MSREDKSIEDDLVIIKKYANRRLYNTAKSAYVTLEHLAAMVREGVDFVVNDAKTGEDITRSVLAQIIFEEEAKGQNMLPTNFLRQLIRLYGDTLQNVVPNYLEASMERFTHNQEAMREQVQSAFGANPAMANMEAMARSNMEMFQNAMRMFTPFSPEAMGGTTAPQPAAKEEEDGDRDEIEAMKAQLQEMQAALSKLTPKD